MSWQRANKRLPPKAKQPSKRMFTKLHGENLAALQHTVDRNSALRQAMRYFFNSCYRDILLGTKAIAK
jgi:hypothetical protein